MLKVEEVYEKQVRTIKEEPDGSERTTFEKALETRECLINTDYIVAVHPYSFNSSNDLNRVADAFPEETKFSVLVVDGNSFRKSEVIVVGSFEKMCRTLQENAK